MKRSTALADSNSNAASGRHHMLLSRVLLGMVGLHIGLAMVGIPLVVHASLGLVVWLLALAVASLAVHGDIGRFTVTLSIALAALTTLQGLFIVASHWVDLFGAIHSINAFVVLATAVALAIEAEEASTPDTRDAKA